MKPSRKPMRFLSATNTARQKGFTLPEYVITLTIACIVSAGIMACFLTGGKIVALAATKLDYNDDIRNFIPAFAHAVRTSTDIDIGAGDNTKFLPMTNNAPRQGNALQVYFTESTNDYVRIYLDTNDQCLKILSSDDASVDILTDAVTNQCPFTAEDAFGNVLTNDQYATVVGVLLQFNPPSDKRQFTNSSMPKDFYQLKTKIARRTPLGYQN